MVYRVPQVVVDQMYERLKLSMLEETKRILDAQQPQIIEAFEALQVRTMDRVGNQVSKALELAFILHATGVRPPPDTELPEL